MSRRRASDGPFRVVVAPHNFEIGGSQINALELAGEIARRKDFEVILYAPDGVLTDRARALGVELHLTTLRESAPSLKRIRELSKLAKRCRADLVHAYEWAPMVDAAYGVVWRWGIPAVATILSMDYPYFVPKRIPSIMGTRDLYEQARSEGRTAYLLEPPVDTEAFRPGALPEEDVARVRRECGVRGNDCLVVVIGRLSASLKLDGLLALVEAVGMLSVDHQLHLALVGDGPARARVEESVRRVNEAAGRVVVTLLGERHDPLPYYLAADVAVGMGSSALRAMAVGKPLLVQGERGFWAVANVDTLPQFRAGGWYGIGNDGESSASRCAQELSSLIDADETTRARLGAFGRELVVREYSLHDAARRLAQMYVEALEASPPSRWERVREPMQLSIEITKYFTSLRFPWLRTFVNRVRGRRVST